MNVESFLPFLLILAPFAIAFFIEALVLYFFKLKKFWGSVGVSVLINLVSVALVYFIGSFILSKVGYEFNGLQLQLPVVAFICWVSIIVEGLLLQLFCRTAEKKTIFLASIVMNILSYAFLYFFIANSH
ncbi:MAG: hypothetical protein EON98_11895 [Chitinophagaceae bacterium]|nr:MAG: hypothetical protein EON98_11895 [Chitinophagaceae bacterium]